MEACDGKGLKFFAHIKSSPLSDYFGDLRLYPSAICHEP
jgi:hypothetical protein